LKQECEQQPPNREENILVAERFLPVSASKMSNSVMRKSASQYNIIAVKNMFETIEIDGEEHKGVRKQIRNCFEKG